MKNRGAGARVDGAPENGEWRFIFGRRAGRRGCCGVDDSIVCSREANSNQLQVRDESALCRGTL